VISADRRSEWSYSAALERALGDPRRLAPPAPQHAPQPAPGGAPTRRGPLTLPIVALIVLLAAAASGLGSWYAVRSTPAAHVSASVAALSSATSSPSASPSTTTGSPPPSPSAPSPSPSDILVSLAPAAAGYPDAAAIQPVITEYFRAINSRDYAGYLTVESPGNALTEQQFQTGFRSTVDSDMLVTSITTAPDGRPAADVTFTSRQQPHDGPDGQSCTNWQVTMFFDDNAGTYTIGTPPADYRASFQAC
jgi:hypothetical protein